VRDGLWRLARAVPSLDLRFADNKSLIDAVTGASLVTFTRASSKTVTNSAGVLETVGIDVPAFDHNPTTGESLGLLVEEQRTNLLLRSEEFDNASWNSAAGARTVTANNQIAPDGTTTADTITADGTNAAHFVSQSATLSAVPYAYSVFAKAGTNNFLQLRVFSLFGGMFANFDLATGVVGTVGVVLGATPTSLIQAYPNGWYRCTMVFTPTAMTSSVGAYIVGSASATGGQTNSLSTSIYLWGADLQAEAFPTSYIPTTTAAVTRSADVASIIGSAFSSWYRQDEGTIFVVGSAKGDAATQVLFQVDNTTSAERNALRKTNTNAFQSIIVDNSVAVVLSTVSTPPFTEGAIGRCAVAYATNSVTPCFNGALGSTDTSATMPTPTQAVIGNGIASFYLNSHIARIVYWPQALPGRLQAITQ
jgi:hypothetical protein